jgi:hypothetical protein
VFAALSWWHLVIASPCVGLHHSQSIAQPLNGAAADDAGERACFVTAVCVALACLSKAWKKQYPLLLHTDLHLNALLF